VIQGQVVGVADGDTVTVLDKNKQQHRVRVAGIDAPEKGQPFGNASKDNLARMIFKRRVEVRCYKEDRYGEVCRVYNDKLRDVGLAQVSAGFAWWYREYSHEQTTQERGAYSAEEANAKAAKRGLWKDPNPVPPWEWRRGKRAPSG
jgi:endonuclease YncB( thermonuclease family)